MARKRSTKLGRGRPTKSMLSVKATQCDLVVDSASNDTPLYNGVVSVTGTSRNNETNQGAEAQQPENLRDQPVVEIPRRKRFQRTHHRDQGSSRLVGEAANTSSQSNHIVDTNEMPPNNGVMSSNQPNQGTQVPEDPLDRLVLEIIGGKRFQPTRHSGQGSLRLLGEAASTSPQIVDTNEMQPNNGVMSSNDSPRTYTPNQETQMLEDPLNRSVLEIVGRNFADTSAPRHITNSLRNHYNGVWPSWKFVPAEVREEIWGEFKEAYYWTEAQEWQVKSIWAEVCGRHLSAMLAEARRTALAESGKSKLTEAKEYNPIWIPADTWRALIEQYWSGPKWEKISAAGRENRLTKKEGSVSKHCAGSIPFMLHKKRMEDELKRPVTQLEVFNRTHKRNKGQGDFIDGKSKVVSETYSATISTKYGSNISCQPTFDPEAWVSATGTTSHGKLYGFGIRERPKQILSQEPNIIQSSGQAETSKQPLSEEQVKQIIQKNAEEMEKQFEKRWELKKAELEQEFVSELDKKIEQRLHHMMAGKGLLSATSSSRGRQPRRNKH